MPRAGATCGSRRIAGLPAAAAALTCASQHPPQAVFPACVHLASASARLDSVPCLSLTVPRAPCSAAVAVVGACLFPLAPNWAKVGVFYLTAGLLALILGVLALRG